MSFFNPPARTRRQITFYAQVLQAGAIVFGGAWALWSYEKQLEAPYDEKQLSLYLETAKVAADLATPLPGQERQKAEQRFWELYWGELAFVETRSKDQADSIEKRMVKFCEATFGKKRCHPESPISLLACAIELSHKESDEIKAHWKPWLGWFNWLSRSPAGEEPCPQAQEPEPSPPASKLQ
jgi:hypothetical protein